MYMVYMICYRKGLNLYIKKENPQMLPTVRLLPVDAVYARRDGHGVCPVFQKIESVVQCESLAACPFLLLPGVCICVTAALSSLPNHTCGVVLPIPHSI